MFIFQALFLLVFDLYTYYIYLYNQFIDSKLTYLVIHIFVFCKCIPMKKSSKTTGVKIAEQPISSALWQVYSEWNRGVKRALDSIDLTPSQSMILSSLLFLSKLQEHVTQIDLSLHSKIDPMTTSTIIRILERKELVKRKEHATDTRAKVVVLTSYGTKMTKQAVKIIEKFDVQFFESLANRSKTFHSSLTMLLKNRP